MTSPPPSSAGDTSSADHLLGLISAQIRPPRRVNTQVNELHAVQNLPVADAPNTVWAVDFQFDAAADGRPVKIASIADEHTRKCLGGLVERNITGDDLINELDPARR